MNKSRKTAALIIMFCMLALPGCSNGSAAKKPADTNGQKPKAPTQLKAIATDLDTIISELDKKFKAQKMDVMQQNIQLIPQTQNAQSQGSQAQSNTQNNQGQNQSKSGQSNTDQSQSNQTQTEQSQSQNSQNNQTQAASQQNQTQVADWQKEYSTLKNIHSTWNTLMPEAVGAGMTTTARDQFDKALEQLTQDISKQKLEQSISDALVLYKNFADLTTLFTTQIPSEYYQVKYETMSAIFEASRKNWTAANDHIPNIKEHWVYLSSQVTDTDSKLLNQTDFALMDLERAIQNKQMELSIIKGEIAMINLKNLEAKLSASS